MSEALKEYYDALERLKRRKARINNDTVAIEAGRKKGSIKKSRPQFAALIAAIDDAGKVVTEERRKPEIQAEMAKQDARLLQQRLDESLEREICLAQEVFQLKREINALTARKVVPIK